MALWVITTTCLLLCCCCRLTHAKASEYQLEEDGLTSCESLRQRAGPQDHAPHCTQDGRFRHVQCSGVTCWCVDSQGQEIPGTQTNNSVPHCVSFCRQQRQAVLSEEVSVSVSSAWLPECQRSGEFAAVQCDRRGPAGQCWCVDPDGMELYGTRQNGRPANCPGSCEVRARRFLHTNRGRSPPQCSVEDGGFLPVQCKFINTTDATELDLTTSFNRFPEAFETFSNFRRAFPSVSSYCYCSDSRGREMDNTGVELLLSEVYDTAFRGLSSGPSFSQTNIYRVLQRRLLALRLALTGLFRCPTACEDQRRAAEQVSSAYVPQCESSRGRYSARQCLQAGGQQCWCVEPTTGTELPGTRRLGDAVDCDGGSESCPAQRRQALSRLFSGPVEPPSRTSSSGPVEPPSRTSSSGLPDSSTSSCTALLQPVKDLLGGGAPVVPSIVTGLSDVLHGLFPSVGLALEALARSSSSPQRLQENLFGGKFLKNAAALNFSGTVGERGALAQLAAAGGEDGKEENTQLVLLVSRTLESPAFLHALRRTLLGLRTSHSASLEEVLTPLLRSCSGVGVKDATSTAAAMFVPSCAPGGLYQEVQCDGAQCWCVDPLSGREVAAASRAGAARCPSRCEAERARALRAKSAMAAGAELHVPACSAEDGGFLPLQCAGGGARCFCVDSRTGSRTSALAAGGAAALTCPASTQTQNLQNRPALCSEALAEVTAFRQEAETIVFLSTNSSRLPLGYAFLLAEGLRLTGEELRVASQSGAEEQARIFDGLLLSRSRSGLQLAAYSTLQWYWRRDDSVAESQRPAGYQPYTPQCDQRGDWLSTQCHHSTGQCWCVDEDGQYIPESLTSRSKTLPKCLSRCQRRRVHTLLSGWLKGSDITSDGHNTTGYSARCEESGQFSVLQTEGAAGWCVNPLTGEVLRAATLDPAGQLTCPSWCELQGALCRPDGGFAPFQCDITSCWCVSEDGQEVGGTRRRASVNAPMSCDRPACPHPVITHGALLCSTPSGGRQSCDLVCHRGYRNALPAVGGFLCSLEDQRWDADTPLVAAACQRPQAFQTVRSTAEMSLSVDDHQSCSSISSNLTTPLINAVCSLKLPVSGDWVTVCDDSSVHVQCDSDDIMRLKVTWAASLSDLPTPDLPDLHDVGVFLNGSRLLAALQGLLGNLLPSLMTSEPRLVSTTTPSFGCSPGYRLDTDGTAGCVVCPAGTFSAEGACLLCPEGTYQGEEGRDFCRRCPRGSSAIGASSASQCVTSCQRRGLRCSGSGDFLPAQPDTQSGGWRCVSAQGDDLVWTNSNEPLSDEQCTVLSRFEAVPGSDLLTGAEDTDILSTLNTDLVACVQACATEPSCHHVAVFTEEEQRQCQLYSTHTLNTHCNTSTQASGFLGNPETELFDWLSCSPRVRGGSSDLLVVRKKGEEFSVSQHQQQSYERMRMTKALSGVFRTLAFSSSSSSSSSSPARGGTSLTDVHRFCQEQCSRDTCCRGFVLNRNVLDGGSVLCGLMGAPSVLQCADEDWDVIGQGAAERVCGAGLTYDPQHRSFLFNFGGQDFSITDAALPADSKNKQDYQASIVTFQAIYLHNGSEPAADVTSPPCTGTQQATFAVDEAVQSGFESLDESSVLVDPKRSLPALSYWLNKMNFNSQQALLWCLSRCRSEQQCHLVDVRQDTAGFHSCLLYPDSTVCGAYDKPLRQPCRPLLPSAPHSAHVKKVDLSGPVKSFYRRVPFQKMVSYSVRSRLSLGDTPLSQGFLECERRCDEDPCCRGMGFVRDTTKSSGGDVVCLSLISLGVQTCSEDDSATTWTTQDCRPSAVRTRPHPFGWYLKPVNQWSKSPALCPPFTLPAPKNNVSVDQWSVVEDSRVTIDPALSAYDVIHVSRDIAGDGDKTRDWCLHACESVESCKAVTISQTHSATRCVLYPDTTSCVLLSPAPKASSPASTSTSCRLVVREPASRVYLRKERLPLVTSVAVPGHGTLRGGAVTASLVGGDRKSVVRYLGVPYARPPIGPLRFRPPQPANWTGSWDAGKARPSCIQPGDLQSAASSEDCLYLNVFVPVGPVSGPVPVLVFFFNPSSANQSPGLLDGSTLAAVGNIVVVTANYRTAALGFLSTGSEELSGNYGLADQEAALRWVTGHASLFGGDGARVTVGAERGGADVTSLLLLPPSPSSSSRPPLFRRMMLMGGSVFSPAAVRSASRSRRQAVQLATELGCVTSDDPGMAACLRQTAAHTLNAAQTKLLAVSGPLSAWSPVVDGVMVSSAVRPLDVPTPFDLLLGSSAQDGLIGRARRIKDFEVLQGRLDGKTAFYEALSRSLGGEEEEQGGGGLVKEAASWLYGLQHAPSPAGYNLFSVALNDATRDMFIVCPSLQMARHWAERRANAFLYHLPESTAQTSADASIPLDVQLVFGTPLQPISSQRFTSTEQRLSLAMMTYFSNFVKTGDPNQAQDSSRAPPAPGLPLWSAVPPPPALPLYKEVAPELRQIQGLQQQQCSFWNDLAPKLTTGTQTAELGAEPVQPVVTPPTVPASQSQTEKDAYN